MLEWAGVKRYAMNMVSLDIFQILVLLFPEDIIVSYHEANGYSQFSQCWIFDFSVHDHSKGSFRFP